MNDDLGHRTDPQSVILGVTHPDPKGTIMFTTNDDIEALLLASNALAKTGTILAVAYDDIAAKGVDVPLLGMLQHLLSGIALAGRTVDEGITALGGEAPEHAEEVAILLALPTTQEILGQ